MISRRTSRAVGVVLTYAGALAVMITAVAIDHSANAVAAALLLATLQVVLVHGWWKTDSVWEHTVLGALFALTSALTAVLMLYLWTTPYVGFMALVWAIVVLYSLRYGFRWMYQLGQLPGK